MLKKILFLSALVFGFATYTHAQKTIKGLVGINFSNLSESPDGTEVSGNAGYQIGGSIRFGDKFYFEPGVQYVSISRDFTFETGEDNELNISENWFKIPLYVGAHLIGDADDDISIRAFVGPGVSFLSHLNSDDDDIIKKDNLESPRWVIDGGVGVDILFLFAELNYEYGLNNFSDDDGVDANHGAFFINIGAHFRL